jgi:hypothetical protein
MFLYFPEFIYRQGKNYFKNTFASKLTEEEIRNHIKSYNIQENQAVKELREKNNILPKIEFKFCEFNFFNQNNDIISEYDFFENKITICTNRLLGKDHLISLLNKELKYAQIYNQEKENKKILTLNDYAQIAIEGCKEELTSLSKYSGKNKLNKELISRCAFSDFNLRFKNDLLQILEQNDNLEIINSEININEFTYKLIENNLF